jgi:hypothetical protein
MIPEELDTIRRLQRQLEHEIKTLTESAAVGTPLLGLEEGRDSVFALTQYARLVGGVHAYTHTLSIIEMLMKSRETAFQGEENDGS